MNKRVVSVISTTLWMGACAPPGPTGPEKAAAYNAEQERLAEQSMSGTQSSAESYPEGSTPDENSAGSTEQETTLQFPMCQVEKKPFFSEQTEGATFRAIVLFTITDDGKTADHCYLRVEGEIKWEEKSLGRVEQWSYPAKFAGQQRERTVTWRSKK